MGNFGLCLLVMEGGLSIDASTLRGVGRTACVVAVAGTLLPIGLGCAFMTAVGFSVTTGIAAGGGTSGLKFRFRV